MSSAVPAPVSAKRTTARSRVAAVAMTAVLSAGALLLSGCGDKNKDKPASQTAAKVNKEEITVHQINFALSQQRALPPDQAASAGRQVLERLIDQELALQKAQDQKLDRDPRVLQQLDAARREIIARAYLERIGAGAAKPTPAEIKEYYDAHPALFKERKLYSLQELQIEAKPDQLATLREKLASSKDIPEFVNFLKSNDFKFAGNQAVRAAEQLPLSLLDRFAAMKDGERTLNPTPQGAQVLVLAGTRSQPVDEQRATPAIEHFLQNERKRKLVEEDLKSLRSAAKIEYVGAYAQGLPDGRPPQPAAAPAAASEPTAVLPVTQAPAVTGAAPQLEVEPMNTEAASAPSAKSLEKGIKGFK